MPTYTVHAPQLPRTTDALRATEQFVFVRDSFHFWAFVLAPLWLLLHRLWLALLIYIVGYGVLGIGLALARAPSNVQLIVALLVALLMGFEASSVWRWTLARRRWVTLGFVVAEDAETAERRFFAEWQKHDRPRAGDHISRRNRRCPAGQGAARHSGSRSLPYKRPDNEAFAPDGPLQLSERGELPLCRPGPLSVQDDKPAWPTRGDRRMPAMTK